MTVKKRGGFALVSVLVALLMVVFLSSIVMDITLNQHKTSMKTIEGQRLYNASQYGLEWGKALLLKYRATLEEDVLVYNGSISSLRVKTTDGTVLDQSMQPTSPETEISLQVTLLDCNYDISGHSWTQELPPLRLSTTGTGGGGGGATVTVPAGFSVVIDPNRLFTFGGDQGAESHAYIIRSLAQTTGGERYFESETMVVITQ
ncbi:MAG: hypothetical protein U9R40_04830 [Synergistota bacterium]|nr:hypothetical protein [Synergistota bacterium]